MERMKSKMLEWTGERYLPFVDPKICGAEIHYEHLHRYAFAAQFVKGKRVLDFASGEGYGSYMLSKEAELVIGIEIDEKAVRHASSTYISDNLEFKQGSILKVPIEGESMFDAIISFEAIEHVEEHEELMKEVKRLLREDGIFIVSSPNKKVYSDDPGCHNPFHQKELYFDEFKNLLNTYFTNIYFFGQSVCTASNLWRLTSKEAPNHSEFVIKKGDDEFYFSDGNEKVPVYFIAVASNADLNERYNMSSSLVDVSNILIGDYKRQIEEVNVSVQKKNVQINDFNAAISVKDVQIGDLEAQITDFSGQLKEKEQQINDFNAAISVKDEQIGDLERQITDFSGQLKGKEQQINDFNAAISVKDEQIGDLERQITDFSGQLKGKEQQINDFNAAISVKDEQIGDLERQITDFSGQLKGKEQQINDFNAAISVKDEQIGVLERQITDFSGQLKEKEERIRNFEGVTFNINTELNSMKSSVTWRTAMKWHSVIEKLMPQGTRRRRWYDLRLIGLRTIITEGWRSYWWMYKKRKKVIKQNFNTNLKDVLGCNVLFVAGLGGMPLVYRVKNQIEQLSYKGIPASYKMWDDPSLMSDYSDYDIFILYRTPRPKQIKKLIKYCNKNDKILLYDTDDLVTDLDIRQYLHLDEYMSKKELLWFKKSIKDSIKIIKQCDAVITSTNYLREQMRNFNDNIFVNENSISNYQLNKFQEISEEHSKEYNDNDKIILGYFSGWPKAHNYDFNIIVPAILKLLESYPNLRLRIAGYLDLPQEIDKYKDRVECIPFRDWDDMLSLLRTVDINLAPLDNNPQKRSKSAIKVLEAALLEVPTVASNFEPYNSTLKDKVNGFLAADDEEWFSKLSALIEDNKLRKEMGIKAKETVKEDSPTAIRAENFYNILNQIIKYKYNMPEVIATKEENTSNLKENHKEENLSIEQQQAVLRQDWPIIRKNIEDFLRRCYNSDFIKNPVLEIGSNGYNDYFKDKYDFYTSNLAVNARDSDLIIDVTDMSDAESDSFGSVIASEVLEHVKRPLKAVREIFRILKPGGMVIITLPFDIVIHNSELDGGFDGWRFTPQGLEFMLREVGFRDIQIETRGLTKLEAREKPSNIFCVAKKSFAVKGDKNAKS